MYYDEGEQGRLKNVFSKLHFSILEYDGSYSIEVYEDEHFIKDTNYTFNMDMDYFEGYDLEYRYFTPKDLLKNYNLKVNEINTILVEYDIVYTKSWTSCGYEHDVELDIKSSTFKRHPHLDFNINVQEILPRWSKYIPNMWYDKNRLWERLK